MTTLDDNEKQHLMEAASIAAKEAATFSQKCKMLEYDEYAEFYKQKALELEQIASDQISMDMADSNSLTEAVWAAEVYELNKDNIQRA